MTAACSNTSNRRQPQQPQQRNNTPYERVAQQGRAPTHQRASELYLKCFEPRTGTMRQRADPTEQQPHRQGNNNNSRSLQKHIAPKSPPGDQGTNNAPPSRSPLRRRSYNGLLKQLRVSSASKKKTRLRFLRNLLLNTRYCFRLAPGMAPENIPW